MSTKLAQLKALTQLLDKELEADTPAKWGQMNAHQMVEHLSLVTLASTGKWGKDFNGDEERAKKTKAIFFAQKYPFPKGVTRPGMKTGQAPPPLRFETIQASKEALHKTLQKFIELAQNEPNATVGHLYFGLLSMEEWTTFHIKHFEHHLMQFGILPEPLTLEMQQHVQQIGERLEVVYNQLREANQAKWGMMNAHEMVEHLTFVFYYATGKFDFPFKGDAAVAKSYWAPFQTEADPWRTVFPPINFTKSPPPLRTQNIAEAKKALKKAYLKYITWAKENPEAITPHGFLGDISTAQWLQVHVKHIDHHLSQFGVIEELV